MDFAVPPPAGLAHNASDGWSTTPTRSGNAEWFANVDNPPGKRIVDFWATANNHKYEFHIKNGVVTAFVDGKPPGPENSDALLNLVKEVHNGDHDLKAYNLPPDSSIAPTQPAPTAKLPAAPQGRRTAFLGKLKEDGFAVFNSGIAALACNAAGCVEMETGLDGQHPSAVTLPTTERFGIKSRPIFVDPAGERPATNGDTARVEGAMQATSLQATGDNKGGNPDADLKDTARRFVATFKP